jgi:hypothetical protein
MMTTKLRLGWHREHFLSPLLQFAEKDAGSTFELVECPGGTGEMQMKMKDGEIDLCIGRWSDLDSWTELIPRGSAYRRSDRWTG